MSGGLSALISALCPDPSASRTLRKVLDTPNHRLSWPRMRKAVEVFENMILYGLTVRSFYHDFFFFRMLAPSQFCPLTRSSFKKRLYGLKAIYKVGGGFTMIIMNPPLPQS